MATDETTPLRLSEPERSYMYMSARNRSYRSKVRQFQCCVCAGLLGAFVVAMVITVSYMVNHDVEDETNSTDITPLNQTDLQNLMSQSWPRPDHTQAGSPKILWATENVDGALKAGQDELLTRDQMETTNPAVPLPPTHPSSLHRKAMFSSAQAGQAARVGTILLAATRSFSKNGQWSGGRGPRLPPSDWMSPQWCPAADHVPECPPTPFRSLDGTCNNLDNPEYGVAMRPFRRGLPAMYGDGISSPRKATDGSELPNAREVSLTVHRPLYRNDPKFTVMLAVWGQFTDHDFTATALSQRSDGTAITCCNSKWQHPECYPVIIMKEDPFYAQYNVTCIDFVRSAAAPTCSLGPREQLNQVTPYIDGSVVYGGDVEMAMDLRTFQGGLLKSSRSPDGRELLPEDRAANDGCNQAEESARGRYCFKSGDARANENLHLTTLHLIMARQHNKLAKQLAAINPNWSDERLYQESRRIVAAQMQHITFNEFLPIVIGRDLCDKLELTPKTSGYYHGYNSSINIQIANEFAASAFRFGHTLLQGLLKMIANDTSSPDYVQMHKMLFNPFGLYEAGYMASTVRGALHTDIQKADTYFSEEVSQKLFQPKAGPCGLDLVSLNVQRGRDHGLQPYVAWREFCGLSRPRTFEDLQTIMDPDTVTRLATMYKSVDDIDVYTGIVSENPMEVSGLLGATATCIITDQFVRFKRGDRFWYETPEAPQAFTPEQLDEVRKTTLSSLLCDNTDSLTEVQPFSMRAITPENPITKCSDLSRPDLSAWAERPRVRLVGTSQGVKPTRSQFVPTAEEHYHKFQKDPTTHVHNLMVVAPRSQRLIIGATVVSGNITGSYGAGDLLTVWDGKLPAAIPYPYLDYPTPTKLPFPVPKPGELVYRGGFLWGGRVDVISANTLRLSANYHLPITPLGIGSKSVREWWCGEAELEFKVNWNSTELYDIPENNYFTPAMFKQVKSGTSKFMSLFEEESNIGKLQARVDRDPLDPHSLPRLPLLLQGQYSADNSIFWWNGNVTFVFPPQSELPTTPVLTSSKEPRKPDMSMTFGGSVTSGSIAMSASDENEWDGSLPLDIVFNYPEISKDLWHGGNAIVSGSLTAVAPQILKFSGNFSVPINDPSLPGTIEWQSGVIEVTIKVAWNNSVISDLVETNSFCFIYLKDSNKQSVSSTLDPNSLLALTPGAPIILNQVMLILDGEFVDSGTFRWSGNITAIIKPTAPRPTMIQAPRRLQISAGDKPYKYKPSWKKARDDNLVVGTTVTAGTITGSFSLDDLETVWSGGFPAAIPAPFLYKPKPGVNPVQSSETPDATEQRGGALWGGNIEITSATTLHLSANYHLPLFANSTEQQWWCGEVELDMNINWNTSELHGLPQGDFFSPILFRKMYKDKNENAFFNLFAPEAGVNRLQATTDRAPLDPNLVPHIPIILQGEYNEDNTIFWWNGEVTLVFPKEKPTPQLKATYSGRAAFGGTVTSGSVVLDSGMNLWSGSVPQDISTVSKAYGKDFLHGGSSILSGAFLATGDSVNFKGEFSIPVSNESAFGSVFWLGGNMEATIKLDWNSTSLESLPQTPTKMYAMIFMQETSKVAKLSEISPLIPPPNELLAMSRGEPQIYPLVFIILHGHFSTTKTFSWSGQMTVKIQSPKSRKLLTLAAPNHHPRLVLGGKVESGKVTAYSGSAPKRMIFDGSLPVAIPMPAFDHYLPQSPSAPMPEPVGPIFHGHGIIWTGSVQPRPGTRQIELYGDFRMPMYLHGYNFYQDWWLGHVELVVNVAWNSTSLDAAAITSMPDADFYSPIRFRADEPFDFNVAESLARVKSSDPDMMDTAPVLAKNPYFPKGFMPRFPIILHGFMNRDRTAFMWTGNLTFVFPYTV